MSGTATVLGFIYDSPVTEFPVRTGPGTNFAQAPFKVQKGTSNLKIVAVEPDDAETMSDFGRVYNWFNITFPDGNQGWMRDHVIGLQGDWSEFGYDKIPDMKHAYLLVRDPNKAKGAKPAADQKPAAETAQPAATTSTTNPLASAAQKTSAQPAQTAQTTQPATTETAQPAPAAAQKQEATMKPSGPPRIIVKMQSAANTRSGPGVNNARTGVTIPRNAEATILEVGQEQVGQKFRWYKVDYNGQQVWIREDLVAYTGDTESLGLPWDLYPAPMDERWWVRDYNLPPNQDTSTWEHWGWDFGAATGEPMKAGPFGGTVVHVMDCTKCTPDKPSTVMQGLGLANQSVLQDPAWGFGYGNFVIVRYANHQLPESTKKALEAKGFPNATAFVMYAHLQRRQCEIGQELGPNQVFAFCGNTGNSEATHLHLEFRAARTAQFTQWANYKDGLMSPIVLFNR